MHSNRAHEKGAGGGGGWGGGNFSAVSVGTAEPHQWAGKTFIHRVHGNRSLPGELRVDRRAEYLWLTLLLILRLDLVD